MSSAPGTPGPDEPPPTRPNPALADPAPAPAGAPDPASPPAGGTAAPPTGAPRPDSTPAEPPPPPVTSPPGSGATGAPRSAPPSPATSRSRPGRAEPRGPARGAGPGPGSAARTALALLTVTALVAAGGAGFQRVFGLGTIAPVIAMAAWPPVLLSALISWPRRRTWPLWVSVTATVAGWTLAAGLTLFHGGFLMVGGALRDSWKGILTTLLPAPDRPALLVLPHALMWLAGAAGAELVLRTRTRAAPALPAVVVFGVAVLLGVGGPGSNLPVAAALAVLAGVLAVLRGGGRPGRTLAAVPFAAALGLVAAAAGPYLPMAGQPYDLRSTVAAPPPQQRDSVSPLDRVSAWLQTPDQQMFTVHASAPEDWRLAVLDRFDGVNWTSGARFVPAGGRIPVNGHAGRTRVEQRFTIQDLPGVWVPAADRPRTIRGLGVTADPASAVLAAARPLHSGQTYTVTSAVRDYDAKDLAAAEPARDAEAQEATALPESPGTTAKNAQVPAFRSLAEQIVKNEETPFQRAERLAEYLKTTDAYDVTGLPGHTYAQLRYFLTRSKRGTSEQFATAYAVLARSVGLPTRVVVGFRPGVGGDGEWQVRSGDVLVWPEVDFARLGWVPFFPTPEQTGKSKKSDSVPAGETQQKLEAAQQHAAAAHKSGTGSGDAPTPHPTPPPRRKAGGGGAPWWVYLSAAVAAVPVLYLIGVLIVPVLRRRRRRGAATPAERITGAWEQTQEALRAVGLPQARALTAHEVARFGARRVEGAEEHLRPLADLVNRSEYAAAPPGPDAAEAAWRHTDQVGRLARRTSGPVRRLGRRLHPRSLRLR